MSEIAARLFGLERGLVKLFEDVKEYAKNIQEMTLRFALDSLPLPKYSEINGKAWSSNPIADTEVFTDKLKAESTCAVTIGCTGIVRQTWDDTAEGDSIGGWYDPDRRGYSRDNARAQCEQDASCAGISQKNGDYWDLRLAKEFGAKILNDFDIETEVYHGNYGLRDSDEDELWTLHADSDDPESCENCQVAVNPVPMTEDTEAYMMSLFATWDEKEGEDIAGAVKAGTFSRDDAEKECLMSADCTGISKQTWSDGFINQALSGYVDGIGDEKFTFEAAKHRCERSVNCSGITNDGSGWTLRADRALQWMGLGDAKKCVAETRRSCTTSFSTELENAKTLPFHKGPGTGVHNANGGWKCKDVMDVHCYGNRYPDLMRHFKGNIGGLVAHYINHGRKEGRQYKCDPLEEVIHGMAQNERDQALCYYARYPDLKAHFGCDIFALKAHWRNHGQKEGRTWGCEPDDDQSYDIQALLQHYRLHGKEEGRIFECDSTLESGAGLPEDKASQAVCYAYRYTDLLEAFGCDPGALEEHYRTLGKDEGRQWGCALDLTDASASHDAICYADANSDVKSAFGYDAKLTEAHFAEFGEAEGRAWGCTPRDGKLPQSFQGSVVYFGGIVGMRETGQEEVWKLRSDENQSPCKGYFHGEYWALNGAVSDADLKTYRGWVWSYERGFDDFSLGGDYEYIDNSNDWVS